MKNYHNVAELVQNSITDFAQVRHDPEIFKSGNKYLVILPVYYREHPGFIHDLGIMMLVYADVFKKLEFLSLEAMQVKSKVSKMIHQVTLFNNTVAYKRFVKYGLPAFLRKWCRTLNKKKTRFIKIKRRKAKGILKEFTIDELLKVFMYLFAFNYDAVKKNNWDLLQKLIPTTSIPKTVDTTHSGINTKSLAETLPPFSLAPFNRSDLKRIEQQSTQT